MTVLIPTFHPKADNTNDGAFFGSSGHGTKDKATENHTEDATTHSAVSQPGILNSPGAQLNLRVLITAAKTFTLKNPGCWLTRFLRFISMATRAASGLP